MNDILRKSKNKKRIAKTLYIFSKRSINKEHTLFPYANGYIFIVDREYSYLKSLSSINNRLHNLLSYTFSYYNLNLDNKNNNNCIVNQSMGLYGNSVCTFLRLKDFEEV